MVGRVASRSIRARAGLVPREAALVTTQIPGSKAVTRDVERLLAVLLDEAGPVLIGRRFVLRRIGVEQALELRVREQQ